MNSNQIVNKLWSYCHLLREDGVSTIEYVEQITYLLFLKMADEQTKTPFNRPAIVPAGLGWQSLLDRSGDALEVQYRHILSELGKQSGTLGTIFRKSQNRIQDPAKLQQLIVKLIEPETWMSMDADVKGDGYEGLLERGASDTKSGAGQYFTPRALIRAMVDVMRPGADQTIADPACGTGGFLLAAHAYISNHYLLDRDQKKFLRDEALRGWELVDGTARLCVMNLLLHGVGSPDGHALVRVQDSLRADPGERFDIVLANPPFGKKSSTTFVNAEGEQERDDIVIVRDDFWASTSNKQLNFVQHIKTILNITGRAAVVIPDNVLFEGGAGETIRRRLLHDFDLHTILRLPTGLFYAQGVKANVMFFDKKPAAADPWTRRVWIFDFRTNQHFTLKQNPLTRAHLDEFVAAFCAEDRSRRVESDRFHSFTYNEVIARDKVNLDITWLSEEDEANNAMYLDPAILTAELAGELQDALDQLAEVAASLDTASAGSGATSLDADGVAVEIP